MKPRVYIESSVVSYLTARASSNVEVRAHQIITQRLWDSIGEFEFFISDLLVMPMLRQRVLQRLLSWLSWKSPLM